MQHLRRLTILFEAQMLKNHASIHAHAFTTLFQVITARLRYVTRSRSRSQDNLLRHSSYRKALSFPLSIRTITPTMWSVFDPAFSRTVFVCVCVCVCVCVHF
jgi:hypothetical protein